MGNIQIKTMQVGEVCTNCYLAANKTTKEALIIDPGDEAERIEAEITKEGVKPVAILLTHGHFDHVMAAGELKKKYGIEIYIHEADKETLESPTLNLCGMIGRNETYHADRFFKDGDELDLAGFHIKVFHTPGHTVGGACYYIEDEHTLFSGDTLFCQSIGRTDFPKGSTSALLRSVKEKLFVLPAYVGVYPGHNDITTIGEEQMMNPYF